MSNVSRETSRAVQPSDPGQRCPALAYTNKPERLVVRCKLPAGHGGSHIEPTEETRG